MTSYISLRRFSIRLMRLVMYKNDTVLTPLFLSAVLSKRGGGGVASVVRGWWGGSDARMKVDIKSFHPEVKASKSVKRFQRYSHFKLS